jgi:DNA-binding transcriptional MocR family regulator
VSAPRQYTIRASSAAELVSAVEDAVAGGALAPGDELPSVRRLASSVGLSPGTVSSALAELRRRGVVLSEPRRGTRIGQGPPIHSRRRPLPVPPGARDLSLGNPDPALLPSIADALAALEPPQRMYGGEHALGELLELAGERMRADGVPAQALCVVSGALDAIERVLEARLRPGDRVAVENPGYAALFDLLRAQGLALEPVGVDDHGMRPALLRAALERGAAAAVITPRGQNPTGAALDRVRAAELREVLAGFPAVLLVEDDHLGPVAGRELHSALGRSLRWAATRSVAKSLGPDLRLALLAGDEQTISRVQGRQQCGPGWVSHILQALVAKLWTDPQVEEQVARAEQTYTCRRARLLEALAREGIEAHGASGLNVWVPVEEEAAVIGALLQRGWVLAPGAAYRLSGSEPGVRATISTLGESEAERLAADLADVLTPIGSSRSG